MAVSNEKKAAIKHNGLEICFEDKGHVYRVFDKDQQLKYKPISVTTLIHKYQKPFELLCGYFFSHMDTNGELISSKTGSGTFRGKYSAVSHRYIKNVGPVKAKAGKGKIKITWKKDKKATKSAIVR